MSSTEAFTSLILMFKSVQSCPNQLMRKIVQFYGCSTYTVQVIINTLVVKFFIVKQSAWVLNMQMRGILPNYSFDNVNYPLRIILQGYKLTA